jgi:hypothetical protein
VIPYLHDASPEAVVVGLDRTQPMVVLGPRAFPLLVGDAVRVPAGAGLELLRLPGVRRWDLA